MATNDQIKQERKRKIIASRRTIECARNKGMLPENEMYAAAVRTIQRAIDHGFKISAEIEDKMRKNELPWEGLRGLRDCANTYCSQLL